MSPRLRATATQSMKFVALPLLGVVIGVVVALASSPNFLTRGNALYSPRPSPPSVTEPGVLGKSPQLVTAGAQALAGMTPNRAVGSADAKTWSTLVPPPNASGIAMDPANPQRGITGGAAIRFTTDGGATWKTVVAPPPGGGPFQVLGVSPFDSKVWVVVHQSKLLMTRDASATWRDIPKLPALSNAILAAGPIIGEFFLGSGNRVFDLIDNAQQVNELPALPTGLSVTALAATGSASASLVARASDGKLYLLGGTQWVAASGAPSGTLAAGGRGTILIGDGGAKLGSPGWIKYSFDAGATWHQAAGLPYDQSVEAIAGQPDSSIFFAYCYGGDVYTSTDGGRSWSLYTRALRATSG
jgi:photosystem II stability/assembly factor-like uncharacterized protein